MKTVNRGFRLLSLVLIVTLVISLATPSRAEAIEPLTLVAIAGVAVIVVVLVIYLVVANMHDSQKKSARGKPRYLACVESDAAPRDCWAIAEPPDPAFALAATPAVIALTTQSP